MPKTESHFTKHLHVLIREDQYDFVKNELNGGIGRHVRQMIDASMGYYDKELTVLEKEYAEVEPRYLFLRKRIEELKLEQKRMEDEQRAIEKRIEDAHTKLLAALKLNNWEPERIQKAAFKIYADYTGLSVEELMDWVKEQVKRREELD